MNYDTLLLSGGGFKCFGFLGSLKYLIEKGIIKEYLEGIKDIIVVSGSCVYILPLILGYSIDATIKLFNMFKMDTLIDIENISIDTLICDYGIYESQSSNKLIDLLLEKKGINNDITLKELYEKTNINISFKTVNITKEKVYYLNHKDNPTIKLKDAICMSGCVPLLFKPFNYNGDLYIDGGFCGNYPDDYNIKSKNYLGIRLNSSNINSKESANNDINTIIDYLKLLYNINGVVKKKKNKKIIDINISGIGVDLSKDNDEIQSYLDIGYNAAKSHKFS